MTRVARRFRSWVWLVLIAVLTVQGESHAGDGGTAERRSRVAARIGPTAVTVGELEDRIARLPPFQRASFGSTPDAVRRRFLAEVVVREELLMLGALGHNFGEEPPAAYRVERVRSAATIRALRGRLGPASAIAGAEVDSYYERNRSRYDAPERYQIWRILCKTREEAQSVLDAARRDSSAANFGTLARDHSLDKATRLRAGNLGFVTGEGVSNEPGLRVDQAVVRAAQSSRDGEIVPQPVAEGEYFAVVWRRATIAAMRRRVEEVAPQIRDFIWKARVKEETDKLVASLRASNLHDVHASLLDLVELPDPDVGEAAVRSRSDAHARRETDAAPGVR